MSVAQMYEMPLRKDRKNDYSRSISGRTRNSGRIEIEDVAGPSLSVVRDRPVRSSLVIPNIFEEETGGREEGRKSGGAIFALQSQKDELVQSSRGVKKESFHGESADEKRKGERKTLQSFAFFYLVSSLPAWAKKTLMLLGAVSLAVCAVAIGTSFLHEQVNNVVVQSGDSLWSIASGIKGAPTVQTAVEDIVALNGLGSERIVAGQTLLIPSY